VIANKTPETAAMQERITWNAGCMASKTVARLI
jgi:hypothetical protein